MSKDTTEQLKKQIRFMSKWCTTCSGIISSNQNKSNISDFSNNCHSHVARALNKCNYQGRSNYTMIGVWWLTITQSKYVR